MVINHMNLFSQLRSQTLLPNHRFVKHLFDRPQHLNVRHPLAVHDRHSCLGALTQPREALGHFCNQFFAALLPRRASGKPNHILNVIQRLVFSAKSRTIRVISFNLLSELVEQRSVPPYFIQLLQVLFLYGLGLLLLC